MTGKFVIQETIGEDGIVHLPPDAPRGQVVITIEPATKAEPPKEPPRSPEEEAALDAEIAALLTPEALRGQGLTAEEIARSPQFGAWEHRDDIASGEDYVEQIRQKRRYTW
jgi:hypothetical protein